MAVALEKLGRRGEALQVLQGLAAAHREEVRVLNNLGIIQKRQGLTAEARVSLEQAIALATDCFFPVYNLGVHLASLNAGPATD